MDRRPAHRLLCLRHRAFRDKTQHTAAEQDWFRGYTEPITRRITQLRTDQTSRPPSSDGARGDRAAGGTG